MLAWSYDDWTCHVPADGARDDASNGRSVTWPIQKANKSVSVCKDVSSGRREEIAFGSELNF